MALLDLDYRQHMARAFRERVLQSGNRLVVSELSRLDAPASNLPGKLAAALHGATGKPGPGALGSAPVGSGVTGSVGVAISILLVGGKVEQFPIARVNEKAIQVLDQALACGGVARSAWWRTQAPARILRRVSILRCLARSGDSSGADGLDGGPAGGAERADPPQRPDCQRQPGAGGRAEPREGGR